MRFRFWQDGSGEAARRARWRRAVPTQRIHALGDFPPQFLLSQLDQTVPFGQEPQGIADDFAAEL